MMQRFCDYQERLFCRRVANESTYVFVTTGPPWRHGSLTGQCLSSCVCIGIAQSLSRVRILHHGPETIYLYQCIIRMEYYTGQVWQRDGYQNASEPRIRIGQATSLLSLLLVVRVRTLIHDMHSRHDRGLPVRGRTPLRNASGRGYCCVQATLRVGNY